MYQINPKNYQWILDIVFGIALILPLVLFFIGFVGELAVYITFGVGIGYIIHVTQKMLVFNDILEEAIEEKAEKKADKIVEDKMGVKTEKDLENKIEKEAEEVND